MPGDGTLRIFTGRVIPRTEAWPSRRKGCVADFERILSGCYVEVS